MQFINKSVISFTFLLFLAACSPANEKLPETILSEDKMIAILIDIQMADAAVILSSMGQQNFPNDKDALFKEVYLKHKVDSKEFRESFNYYCAHPEKFEKMYDDVISGLSKKQAELAK